MAGRISTASGDSQGRDSLVGGSLLSDAEAKETAGRTVRSSITEARLPDSDLILEAISRLDRKLDFLISWAPCQHRPQAFGAADGEDSEKSAGTDTNEAAVARVRFADSVEVADVSKSSSRVVDDGFFEDSESPSGETGVQYHSAVSSQEVSWLLPRSTEISGPKYGLSFVSRDDSSRFREQSSTEQRSRFTRPLVVFKSYFDVIGMIFLSVDVVMVPFGLAWEDVGERFFRSFGRTSVAFWTLDTILNFLMPYERHGVFISDCRKTTWHYMRRSFVLDLLVVVIEWISVVLSATGESIDAPQSLFKIVRFAKIIRMLRALTRVSGDRYRQSLEALRRRAILYGLEVLVSFVTGTGRYFMFLVWLSHFGSCLWYYLIRTEDASVELSWSFEQRADAGEDMVGENPTMIGWWYMTGVYFTAVSLVSCSSPMPPHSVTEMVLALTLHLFGWVFGSLLVSTLAAWLVELNAKVFERRNMQDTLRGYLKQHNVSPLLALTIRTQVVQRTCARQHICEEDVKALQVLSPALLESLAFQVHRPNLVSEHVLGALQRADNRFLTNLCSFDGAFHARSVEPGQIMFLPDEHCNQAMFIVRGDLWYTKTAEYAMRSSTGTLNSVTAGQIRGMEGVVHLSSGDWIAEVSLWVRWRTQGVAELVSHGEVFTLRAAAVWDALLDIPRLVDFARAYSIALADVLHSTARIESLSDVNTHGSADTASRVSCRLQIDHRLMLSQDVLENMKATHKGKSWQKSLRMLEEEIHACKSTLVIVNKEPERVVFLSVLEMCFGAKRLTEVGYIATDGEFRAVMPVLPATKVCGTESAENAAIRLLNKHFNSLEVPLVRGSEKSEKSTSGRYKLTTSYHKQTFTAEVPLESSYSWAQVVGYGRIGWQAAQLTLLVDKREIFVGQRSTTCSTSTEQPRIPVFAWIDEAEEGALESGECLTFVGLAEEQEESV